MTGNTSNRGLAPTIMKIPTYDYGGGVHATPDYWVSSVPALSEVSINVADMLTTLQAHGSSLWAEGPTLEMHLFTDQEKVAKGLYLSKYLVIGSGRQDSGQASMSG